MTSIQHQYLDYAYKNIQNSCHNQAENASSIYGEILYPSFSKILNFVDFNNYDCFVDIGAGIGKVCLQVALNTDIKNILGFEILTDRVAKANTVLTKARIELPDILTPKDIQYFNQDFTNFNFNAINATNILAYSCSTCFTKELLYKIGDTINNNDKISKLLSLRPIPNLTRLKLKSIIDVECSWDSAECFIYE